MKVPPIPPAVPLAPPSRLLPASLGLGPLLCLFVGGALLLGVLCRAFFGPLVPAASLGMVLLLASRPLLDRRAAARLGPRGPVAAGLALLAFVPLSAWLALWALAVPMDPAHRDRYLEEIFMATGLGLVLFLVVAGNAAGLWTRHLLLRKLPSLRLLSGLLLAALALSVGVIAVACVRAAHFPDPDRFMSLRGSILRVQGNGETVPFSALAAAGMVAPPLGWILAAVIGVLLCLLTLRRQGSLRAFLERRATWHDGTLTPEGRIFFAEAIPPCDALAGTRVAAGPVVVIPLGEVTQPTYREQGGLGPIQVIPGTSGELAERLLASLCAIHAHALAALCLTLPPLLLATILLR